jgi:hypothetical protein
MKYLKIILIPVFFALLLRVVFGISLLDDFLSVMTWTFFILVPVAIGALTVYYSNLEKVKSVKYRFFAPWVPIILIIGLTILIGLEGWACWIMISPLFFIFGSVGGLIAGHFKIKKSEENEMLNLCVLMLLPFVIAPIEKSIPLNPEVFRTYTSIIINSDDKTIWNNVTSVKEIKEQEDSSTITKWLGFPKPIKAELDKEEVGGYRKAIFEKGLIFNETVTEYNDLKLMRFKIKANTYEIPSTTLDEHILIGGEYFDMLNGTYELEKISKNQYKLILYSNFSMKTTFNSYAGIWGKWIMKDIQNNILKVIKERSENQK